jgi:hypothetical protein
MATRRFSAAYAATLLPLAIGLGMNAAASRARFPHPAASPPAFCSQFDIDTTASTSLGQTTLSPGKICTVRMSNGFPLPDSVCTPGAINPTVTAEVLENPSFRTSCIRGQATSEAQKSDTYRRYEIPHPSPNTGSTQTCELDHLISLELGGADTLDNIWPQCGPDGVALSERYFKRKDGVENFLARQVREGKMPLDEAQKGIASDWTQFLAASEGCESAACE